VSEESLHIRLDRALRLQFRNLFGEPDKKVYCWRRYLSRLKEFKTISLDLLLANLELF